MSVIQIKRIGWVDYAKVGAILGVVMLHTYFSAAFTMYFKAFVIPLFFFISGFLFSYDNNPDYSKFVKKRFRQLVVPYLWINVLAYFFWVFFLRNYGNESEQSIDWYIPVAGIFAGIPPLLVHDIPLWSLLSFFVVDVVFYPLYRFTKSSVVIAFAAFILLFVLKNINQIDLSYIPFSLSPSIAGLGFYAIGYNWRNSKVRKKSVDNSNIFFFITAIISAISFYFIATANGFTSVFICQYGKNLFLFIAGALSGIVLSVSLCVIISRIFKDNAFIRFVSTGTLLICGFHMLAFAFIKGICLFIFGISPEVFTYNSFAGFTLGIGGFMLTLPIIHIIRSHFRFLVDK